MLVLSRKEHEGILIGENIRVCVSRIEGDKVRLANEAPREMLILREELRDREPRNGSRSPTPEAP